MPTPMHGSREIASRYGVDVTSREALSHFFNHTLATLAAETQLAIAQELIDRDGEKSR